MPAGSGPSISTASPLPGGTVGAAYTQTLSATGGTPSYVWSLAVGSLPSGLSLSGGVLSGTPTTAGQYSFTLTVTDGANQSASRLFSLTVASAASPDLIITTTGSDPLPITIGGTNTLLEDIRTGRPTAPQLHVDSWLLPSSMHNKRHPNFSTDGRLVAYSSNESGRLEVYIGCLIPDIVEQ